MALGAIVRKDVGVRVPPPAPTGACAAGHPVGGIDATSSFFIVVGCESPGPGASGAVVPEMTSAPVVLELSQWRCGSRAPPTSTVISARWMEPLSPSTGAITARQVDAAPSRGH